MTLLVETFTELGVTRLSRWIFNCYLIHDGGNGAPVAVDAGLPGVDNDLLQVMAEVGLDPTTLAAVFATHAHSDHVGGAPSLSLRSGAPVYLPQPVDDYLHGVKPRSPRPAAIARIWPTMLDQPFDGRGARDAIRGAQIAGYGTSAGMRWPKEHRPRFFPADGALPGAPDWHVIATPGHTDDSVAFWNPTTRTLLSGDAIISAGGLAWITPETVDDSAHTSTGERLRKLDVAHLLPGHGRPVHGQNVTATALTPACSPRRALALPVHLARCLTGRRAR